MLEKTLPHDMEVEKALLCCILLDEDYQEKLVDINLTPSHFYLKQHQYIYEAILKLEMESKTVDIFTLTDKLASMNKLTEAGGPAYLSDIQSTLSTTANIFSYAEIIENKYLLRSLISISTEAVEESFQESEPANILLDRVSRDIFTLSEKKNKNKPVLLDKAILSTFKQIESWSKRKGSISGLTTGYRELDKMTAGWQKNALIVLAARPSMGKTQLALNFAVNAANQKDKSPIAIFSLEMGKNELAMRLMSMYGNIPLSKLKTGNMSDQDWQALSIGMGRLGNLPIYIDDSTSLNVLELRTKARRLKKDHNIQMLIIDYIGLMETDSGVERHEGISRISRALKGLAKELEIPVFILSQLNREVEKRNDKRPMLSDLRDSGAIEQDADIVLFLLRPEFYKIKDENGNDQDGKAIVIIGKHRNGPTGDVELYFDKKNLKFEEPNRYGDIYNK